jgi:hypothetical protein
LSITNNIKERIYSQDNGKISNSLKRPLQESLAPAPDIILITLVCSLKTLEILVELPQKTTPYITIE